MSAFRFALQPLLDARTRAEDEARAELAAAAAQTAAARVRACGARAAFAAAIDGAGAQIGFLADAVRLADIRVQRCAASETCARERFAVARSDRRRVETLYARARAEFRRAAARAETLLHDEANAARHNLATFVPSSLHI